MTTLTENVTHSKKFSPSRRFFMINGTLGGLGILLSSHFRAINKGSHGTIFTAAQSITNHVSVAELESTDTYHQLYAVYGKNTGITEAQWVEGGIGRGIDIGTSVYWDTPLSRSLPLLIDQLKLAQIDPAVALPVIGYWGNEKIKSNVNDTVETIEQLTQTVASHEIAQADALLSRLLHRRKPLQSIITGDYHWLKNFRYSSPIYRQKLLIKTRTTGFFDKEAINYADAIIHSIESGSTQESDWDSQFLGNLGKLTALQMSIMAVRENSGVVDTRYDNAYLATAHEIEKYILVHGRELNFGVQSLCAFMRFHQDILAAAIDSYGWNQTELKPQQKLMLVYWSLLGSDGLPPDYAKRPFQPYFNPLTDSFADPKLTIPFVVKEFGTKFPEIKSQTYWNETLNGIEDVLDNSPIPPIYSYIPYLKQLRSLAD